MDSRAEHTEELALARFAEGYNCAEAVFLALAQKHGVASALIPGLATGLGAGVGTAGEVCGAVTGAVLGLGLWFGRTQPQDTEAKALAYEKTISLVRAFTHQFGAVRCRDLTGCDMTTPEGKALAKELNLHTQVCPKFVKFAAHQAALLANLP